MNGDPERIGLFGGTFDPIHLGHLSMAETAHEAADLDRVIFIPCRRSPFKEAGNEARSRQRLEMIELSLQEEGWDWASASSYEIDREPPSYSWQTVEHFENQFPGAELFWILGDDQWAQIDRWTRADYLRDHLTFIVMGRQTKGNGNGGASSYTGRPGWRSLRVPFDHPASATEIRDGDYPEEWITRAVAAYVLEQGLYQPEEETEATDKPADNEIQDSEKS